MGCSTKWEKLSEKQEDGLLDPSPATSLHLHCSEFIDPGVATLGK